MAVTPGRKWESVFNPPPEPVTERAEPAAGGEPAEERPDFSKPYKAFGHPRPDALRSMFIYLNTAEQRKYGRKKFQIQYEHLDSDDPMSEGLAADGRSFSIVVSGARQPMRITVHGVQMEEQYDYIPLHRMPWIRSHEPGRNFGQHDGPVITSIEIEPLEEEEAMAGGRALGSPGG
jgi:hypothetical protein